MAGDNFLLANELDSSILLSSVIDPSYYWSRLLGCFRTPLFGSGCSLPNNIFCLAWSNSPGFLGRRSSSSSLTYVTVYFGFVGAFFMLIRLLMLRLMFISSLSPCIATVPRLYLRCPSGNPDESFESWPKRSCWDASNTFSLTFSFSLFLTEVP